MPRDVAFFEGVRGGVDRAIGELQDFGLRVHTELVSRSEPGETVTALERLLARGVRGLIVTAEDDPQVRSVLEAAASRGISVIAYNSDVAESCRTCFVGQDLEASGRVAADLMAKILPDGATVLVVTGKVQFQAQSARLAGFRALWPGPVVVAEGQELRAVELREVGLALSAHPEIQGAYVAAGSADVILGLVARHPGPRVRVICNDLLPEVRAGLEVGTVDFTLLQDEAEQGYRPVKLLFEHFTEGKPLPRGNQFVTTTIITRETLRRTS